MFEKYLLWAFITALLGKFIITYDLSMPEAFVYTAIGTIIVGYWIFAAWLKAKTQNEVLSKATMEDMQREIESLSKNLSEIETKTNAIVLRLGIGR